VLRDTRQIDNTVVIFTSDNGYFWGEHALGDKRAAYEESIRIPLTVRYPKLFRGGARRPEMVLNIDLAPTILELAGVKPPPALAGRPLGGRTARRSFLAEYFAEPNFPRIPSWQALRTDRWKYIHYTGVEGMDELYDLVSDPYEMTNVIVDPAAQKTLRQMQLELQAALRAS
jgi:N-acetylglucosamine-6-sulfatase